MEKKDFKILLIYPNVMLANTIPIGITLLSSCLKKAGYSNIILFDTTFYKTQEISGDEIRANFLQLRKWNYKEKGVKLKGADVFDDFEELVKSFNPDIIATTMVEVTWELTAKLFERIRYMNIPTIVGGVLATLQPEKVLSHDFVDMICVGEGEDAIVELCDAIRLKKPFDSIPNIWLKTNNGKISKTKIRPLIELDSLPFLDLSIIDEERFFRPQRGKIVKMFPVEITRGCPYACTFCCSSAWSKFYNNKFYRQRSWENIFSEMRFQRDTYSMEYIYFSSETFLAMSEERFDEFLQGYRSINLPFWCQSRPETIQKQRISKLSEFDFRLSVGIECGDEKFRKNVLNRKVSNEKIIDAIDILNSCNIPYAVNNMIGFPGETREDIFATIGLNRSAKVKDVNVFIFVPFRGTKLHELSLKNKYINNEHIAQGHTLPSTLSMPQISTEEIYGLFRTFPLYVKLPSKYWKDIKRAEKFDNEGNKIYHDLSELYYETLK